MVLVGDAIAAPQVDRGPIVCVCFDVGMNTIVEAIGREPERPSRFDGIEALPRHVVDLPNDADALKALISSVVDAVR